MEREAIIKSTVNGNPNSLHYRSFVPKNTPKDTSFSTYLKPEPPKMGPGEDIVGGNIDDCDQISVFEAENYFNERTDQKEKTKKMSNNMNLDCSVANPRLAYRVSSFHATPTASSEASWNSQSGLLTNPQGSAPISLRSLPNDSPKRGSKRVKNWFLMRKCPCFGNKSVQIVGKLPNHTPNSSVFGTTKPPNIYDSRKLPNTTIFEPKKTPHPTSIPSIFDPKKIPIRGIVPTNVTQTQSLESQRSSFTANERKPDPVFSNFHRISSENQFPKKTHLRSSNNGNGFQVSFPIINSQFKNPPNPNPKSLILEDPPRESLEVFQSARESGGRMPWRATSPMSRIASTEDDVESDASSDLFEIESLFTNTNTNTNTNTITNITNMKNANSNLIFNSMEETAAFNKYRPSVDSVAATECYAPSEASVEWSVATAEGFDRGSVANFSASVSQVDFGTKYSGGGESDTWHGLGCRGEKDVCVGRRVGKEGGGAWGGGRDGFGYKGW